MRAKLPRPVWLLGWVSFFTDLASEAIYPLLPLFLSAVLGAGAIALGLIEGVAEAANSLLKILSGHFSDRWRVRKPIVLGGYTLSSLVRPLMALVTVWPQVLALRFVDRLGKGIRGAPRDAMLADLAPPGLRGRVFGANRAMDHAGAVAGPLIASLFLWLYPGELRTLFAMTVIPGVMVVAILVMVPEVKRAGEETETETGGGAAAAASAPLPSAFYQLLGVILLFTLGNSTDAFLLLRLSQLAVPPAGIPLVWARSKIAELSDFAAADPEAEFAGQARKTALEFGLVSAYTSFLAVDASRVTEGTHGTTVPVAVPVPACVKYETTIQKK